MLEGHGWPRIARQSQHQIWELLVIIYSLALRAEWCDAAVEDVIASCDGDVMKALKFLLVANEHLEMEVEELHAAMETVRSVESGAHPTRH
jgi:hypothetical protein